MVTGAVAAIAYGEPRMTNDVDVVVRLAPGEGRALAAVYPAAEYYVPPIEVIEQERQRRRQGHFNVIHHDTGLRADFYLIGDDPLHQWAWERRQTASIGGDAIWFAPLEYVIIRKFEYFEHSGSDRHVRDIRGILRISGGDVRLAELALDGVALRECCSEALERLSHRKFVSEKPKMVLSRRAGRRVKDETHVAERRAGRRSATLAGIRRRQPPTRRSRGWR